MLFYHLYIRVDPGFVGVYRVIGGGFGVIGLWAGEADEGAYAEAGSGTLRICENPVRK